MFYGILYICLFIIQKYKYNKLILNIEKTRTFNKFVY